MTGDTTRTGPTRLVHRLQCTALVKQHTQTCPRVSGIRTMYMKHMY